MEALVVRLSQLDTHVEGAIRVVMFYDTLVSRRVDVPALVRASAGLAECVVGIELHGTGRLVRSTPDGGGAPSPATRPSTLKSITLDHEEIGTAWLERVDVPGPLDDLLLERLALAAATVVERDGAAPTTMADPALVELAIGSDSDETSRARALRLLGLAPDLPVRVAAVLSPLPLHQVGTMICGNGPVKAARLCDVGVILAPTLDPARFPDGVRAGVGGAERPDRSWQQAHTALRFATARQPVVRYGDLGAMALLATVPDHVARENPDVVAIERLAADAEALETLAAYCDTGSLRRAAELLHLHHTSVARRLEHVERTMSIPLSDPAGLTRARVGLTAWRLLRGAA